MTLAKHLKRRKPLVIISITLASLVIVTPAHSGLLQNIVSKILPPPAKTQPAPSVPPKTNTPPPPSSNNPLQNLFSKIITPITAGFIGNSLFITNDIAQIQAKLNAAIQKDLALIKSNLKLSPPLIPIIKSQPQKIVTAAASKKPTKPTTPTPTPTSGPMIDMKMLIISADGSESDLPAIKAFLDNIGVPYDTMIASQTQLTAANLAQGDHGFYQGVILTTEGLGYSPAPSVWESAFTSDEWSTLWQYEANFGIRQVNLYTFPSTYPDPSAYGLTYVDSADTSTTPLNTSLTSAGQAVFPYLNPSNPLQITNAWTYLATPTPGDTSTTPLLVTSEGDAIASIHTYSDGRQDLTITTDHNPYLTHSLALSYGIINWVAKGVFVGERHTYLTAQFDDLFIPDDIWDPSANSDETGLEFRLDGTDFQRVVAWQNGMRNNTPNAAALTLEMAFNGQGVDDYGINDSLNQSAIANKSSFKWVSHTYSHLLLTDATYSQTLNELVANNTVATTKLGLSSPIYYEFGLVTPEISGLSNTNALRAAADFGMKYLVSDTSHPEQCNPTPNTGCYSPLESRIFLIPRRPTNLYYNVSTPDEWVSEYNYFYGPSGIIPTWNHNLSYQEILDKESDMWLRYLLNFSIDPLMFHQPDLRAYDRVTNPNSTSVQSLFGDLFEATITKYNNIFQQLPIQSPGMQEMAQLMLQRQAYNNSGLVATLYPTQGKIALTATNAATIPITGIAYGSNHESYAGQDISYIQMNASIPQTLTVPGLTW